MQKLGKQIGGFLIGVLLLASSMPAVSNESRAREYKIKAAYLYNLIKFINWPKTATPQTTTHICVIGDNPFGQNLNKLTHRSAKGMPITVSHQANQITEDGCHIIFVAHKSMSKNLLSTLSGQSILTVGEHQTFTEQGGLISLVVINNNVQLQINLSKAKAEGFEISGNLLEIAKIVK